MLVGLCVCMCVSVSVCVCLSVALISVHGILSVSVGGSLVFGSCWGSMSERNILVKGQGHNWLSKFKFWQSITLSVLKIETCRLHQNVSNQFLYYKKIQNINM